jgi:hypothetical protein
MKPKKKAREPRTASERARPGPSTPVDPRFEVPVLAKRVRLLEEAVGQLLRDRIAMCYLLAEDHAIDLQCEELEARKTNHGRQWAAFKASRTGNRRLLQALLHDLQAQAPQEG